MTPVQIDWLTLLLCPLSVAALLTGYFGGRRAAAEDGSVPGWAKGIQGVGMALLLVMVLLNTSA